MNGKSVVIDCFPESARAYRDGWAVVAIDVIRATTTAVTGVAQGRRCLPVPTLQAAQAAARKLPDALLVGEVDGVKPNGFHLHNSPYDLACRHDVERPMVLLSSSGTRLICAMTGSANAYVASLRNHSAVARHLLERHDRVALIGAGSKGTFRDEDQLCCALIAGRLLRAGFEARDPRTLALVEYWTHLPLETITDGDSARYLQRSGQARDLEFVLTHVDDLDLVCRFEGGEVSAEVEEAAIL